MKTWTIVILSFIFIYFVAGLIALYLAYTVRYGVGVRLNVTNVTDLTNLSGMIVIWPLLVVGFITGSFNPIN